MTCVKNAITLENINPSPNLYETHKRQNVSGGFPESF